MAFDALRADMPGAGQRLNKVLGRPHAIPALIVLHQQPGIGVRKLAELINANERTGKVLAEHFQSFGLVKVEERSESVAGKPWFSISLTQAGESLARRITSVAQEEGDLGAAALGEKVEWEEELARARRALLQAFVARDVVPFEEARDIAALRTTSEFFRLLEELETARLLHPALVTGKQVVGLADRGRKAVSALRKKMKSEAALAEAESELEEALAAGSDGAPRGRRR